MLASIWRFAEFFSENAFNDGTWASVNLVIWCCAEPGVYLIAACLLALRPLLNYLLHDRPLSVLAIRFRSRRTKDYNSFSHDDSRTHGIELSSRKKKHGNELSQDSGRDVKIPDWGDSGAGIHMQSTAERGEITTPLPTPLDGVHVKQTFSLSSQGPSNLA